MPPAADNPLTPAPPPLRCVLWHPPGAQLPTDLLNSLSRRIGHIAVCTDSYSALAEVCAIECSARRSATDSQTPHPPSTVLLLVHPEQLSELAETLAEIRTHAPTALCWKFDASANPKLSAVVDSDVAAWISRGTGSAAAAEPGRAGGTGTLPSAARTTHGDEQQTLSQVSSPFTPSPVPSPTPPRLAPESQPSPPPSRIKPAAAAPTLRLAGSTPPSQPEIVVRPQPPRGGGGGPPNLTLRGEMPAGESPRPAPPPPRPVLTAEEMRMLLGDDPIDGPDQPKSNGRHPGSNTTPPKPDRAGDGHA